MPAPTVNSGHTTQNTAGSVTNHVVNTPTHSEGDVIYIFAALDGNITMTKPSGFSVAFENTLTHLSEATGSLWYKTAGASEPSTYTWTSAIAERSVSLAFSVSGDGGIDVISANTTGDSATATCADATSTVDDTLVLRLVHVDRLSLPHGLVSGHTWIDSHEYTSGATVSAQYKIQDTAGAVGQALVSITSEQWAGRTVIIAPSETGWSGGKINSMTTFNNVNTVSDINITKINTI